MSNTRIIKCPICSVFNTNKEYCKNCNTLISDAKKREIKKEKIKQAEIQDAIVAAATSFEERVAEIEQQYRYTLANMKLIPTERREAMEIII